MKKRILGRTGLKVSEIGFGAWAIGGQGYGPTRDEDSRAALEKAWDQGVNFFDTADTYGSGHSEALLAGFLKGKPRDQIVIASKAGWDFYHGPAKKNFAPEYLRFACEQSLRRLKIDALDVYQLHNPTPEFIERGEAVGALEALQKEGKIRYIGISIHSERDALAVLADNRVDALQLVFHLLDPRMSDRVFGEASKAGRGLIVREPLACGLLSGKYGADHVFEKTDHRRRWIPAKRKLDAQKVERVKKALRG